MCKLRTTHSSVFNELTESNRRALSWFNLWRLFDLRVRAVFHKTVEVCHIVTLNLIGYMCGITVIFGALKDGSLLINILASNNCFSYRNIFRNGVDALSKIGDAFFVEQLKILSSSDYPIYIMFKFYLVRIIR